MFSRFSRSADGLSDDDEREGPFVYPTTKKAKTALGREYKFIRYFKIFSDTMLYARKDIAASSVVDTIVAQAKEEHGATVVDILITHFNKDEPQDYEQSFLDSTWTGVGKKRIVDIDSAFLKRIDLRDIAHENWTQEEMKEEGSGKLDDFSCTIRECTIPAFFIQTEALIHYWMLEGNYMGDISRFILNCLSSAACAAGRFPPRARFTDATFLHIVYYNSKVGMDEKKKTLVQRFLDPTRVTSESPDWVSKMVSTCNYLCLDLAIALKDYRALKEILAFASEKTFDLPGRFFTIEGKIKFLSNILQLGDMDLYEGFFQTEFLNASIRPVLNNAQRCATILWNSGEMIVHTDELEQELLEVAAFESTLPIWERLLQDVRVPLDSDAMEFVAAKLVLRQEWEKLRAIIQAERTKGFTLVNLSTVGGLNVNVVMDMLASAISSLRHGSPVEETEAVLISILKETLPKGKGLEEYQQFLRKTVLAMLNENS